MKKKPLSRQIAKGQAAERPVLGPVRNCVGSQGQALAIVVIILLVTSIMVPLMVFYTQREALWTAKQSANTSAFHMAEAGIEKGYLAVTQSTVTWANLQNGTLISNYKFDKAFTDLGGGSYAISITSGPAVQQCTIISIGRDTRGREVRAIKAVYSNSPLGGFAVYSGAGLKVDNKVTVEWGAAVSPQSITLTGANTTTYPQFWSAGSIDVFDTNPNPPNCDGPSCCQWHTYSTNIPPAPTIDLDFYKSSATAQTGCPAGGSPSGSCYYSGNTSFSGVTDTGGKTLYIDGNLTVGSPGIDIIGNLIVMGTFSTGNGVWGNGNHSMAVPQTAWKQYCKNWAHYQTFDGSAPSAFPGLNSSYTSAASLTSSSNKLAVKGLLYVQENLSVGTGNGNTDVNGVMYILGSSTMSANSSVTLYYDEETGRNMKTTNVLLTRQSWQDVLYSWPSAL
ncbi:MAG: hypothetical protein HY921_11285 [Elusimicrobia bacterium]|nr:hypothetical protein [Elusimicrobiota bacterium]